MVKYVDDNDDWFFFINLYSALHKNAFTVLRIRVRCEEMSSVLMWRSQSWTMDREDGQIKGSRSLDL